MSTSASGVGRAVQADWDNREFSETVKLNIRRIYEFVAEFESATRGKLAMMNEKLSSLERTMDMLEAQVGHATAAQQQDKEQ